MFVPRALRLKGIREPPRPKSKSAKKISQPSPSKPHASNEIVVAEEPPGESTGISLQLDEPNIVKPDSRFTSKTVTSEYIAEVAAGIELIFTDYAHQESERAKWLQDHYRNIDEGEKFVHLTAILQHPSIASMKPEVSQLLLQQAVRDHPSSYLELSENGYYIRRKPSSYPLHFLPEESFEIFDDEGLAFWDQRTIYVEPHLRALCQTPGRVTHWLESYGQLKPKWLPIQAVHMLWNSCAFVVLSGNVMHADIWQKWRLAEKPDNWKVMTKVEHTRRTAEYVALLTKQNPGGMRRDRTHDSNASLPAVARPAALPSSSSVAPENKEQRQGRKRRKKRKICKSTVRINDTLDEEVDNDQMSQ